jgi:RsmE family RNA methyltransferase
VNLIIFEDYFQRVQLKANDPRAQHLRRVLRVRVGDTICVGFVNNGRAWTQVQELHADGSLVLELQREEPSPALLPIHGLFGMPRPHTAKRVLYEMACLGLSALHFYPAKNGEASYAQSRLWKENLWRERLLAGLEQSFATQLPELFVHTNLADALAALHSMGHKVALDNYEAAKPLDHQLGVLSASLALAIGSERGWAPEEREQLRAAGWQFAHLGPRVLRVETASVAAVSLAAARKGLWTQPTIS